MVALQSPGGCTGVAPIYSRLVRNRGRIAECLSSGPALPRRTDRAKCGAARPAEGRSRRRWKAEAELSSWHRPVLRRRPCSLRLSARALALCRNIRARAGRNPMAAGRAGAATDPFPDISGRVQVTRLFLFLPPAMPAFLPPLAMPAFVPQPAMPAFVPQPAMPAILPPPALLALVPSGQRGSGRMSESSKRWRYKPLS